MNFLEKIQAETNATIVNSESGSYGGKITAIFTMSAVRDWNAKVDIENDIISFEDNIHTLVVYIDYPKPTEPEQIIAILKKRIQDFVAHYSGGAKNE